MESVEGSSALGLVGECRGLLCYRFWLESVEVSSTLGLGGECREGSSALGLVEECRGFLYSKSGWRV